MANLSDEMIRAAVVIVIAICSTILIHTGITNTVEANKQKCIEIVKEAGTQELVVALADSNGPC